MLNQSIYFRSLAIMVIALLVSSLASFAGAVEIPVITGFTPSSGLTGSTVTISGSNFTGANAVKFHTSNAPDFTVNSDTEIIATVPAGAATGKISIITPQGKAVSAASYRVIGLPVVNRITPDSGKVGAIVFIAGSNFDNAASVTFNGTTAEILNNNATGLRVKVPSGATSGPVRVTTAAGTSGSAAAFTVIPDEVPTITSFTPSSGGVGTVVTLYGTSFTGATSVKFNSSAATFTVVTAKRITATVPAGAATGKISVTTPWGTTTSATDFTVTPRNLVLLHTSDEHSRLLAVGPESEDYPSSEVPADPVYLKGGIARRSTVFRQLREQAAAAGAAALTFSSGDSMMGSLAHVANPQYGPDYTAMKQLGYDAVTFGNHDFELGSTFVYKSVTAAMNNSGGSLFPIVASNIKFNDETELSRYLDEGPTYNPAKPIRRWHVITTTNHLRVGIVGIMGVNASQYAPGKTPIEFSCSAAQEQNPQQYDVCLEALKNDVQAQVSAVRSQGVDLVIALGHTGLDSNDEAKGESVYLAKNVTGIDVLLSGHSHLLVPYRTVVNTLNKPVIVAEPGGFGDYVNKLAITIMPDGTVTLDPDNCRVIPVTNAITADPALKPLIETTISRLETSDDGSGKGPFVARSLAAILPAPPTATAIGDLYFYSMGTTAFDVLQATKAREMPMFRLVADAFLSVANDNISRIQENYPSVRRVDIAMDVSGYTRDSIWKGQKGKISFADIFRSLPLGKSPVDGTLGHPLVAVGLQPADLLGLLTLTPLSYLSENYVDYFTTTAGLCVSYDPSLFGVQLPVLKIVKSTADNNDRCTGDVLFDVANNGANGAPDWQSTGYFNPQYVTTTFVAALDYYHLTAYPLLMGPNSPVKLRAPDGAEVPYENRDSLIIHHADRNELKSFEALAAYIFRQTGGLPARYADTDAKRMFCSGPLCGGLQ